MSPYNIKSIFVRLQFVAFHGFFHTCQATRFLQLNLIVTQSLIQLLVSTSKILMKVIHEWDLEILRVLVRSINWAECLKLQIPERHIIADSIYRNVRFTESKTPTAPQAQILTDNNFEELCLPWVGLKGKFVQCF